MSSFTGHRSAFNAEPSNVVALQSSAMTDGALVNAARRDEPWASRELYERHARWVYGLALRLAPDAADVDDLVQDAFVAAFESLDKLQEAEHFSAWLRGIVVRLAARRIRWLRLRRRLGFATGQPFELEKVLSESASPDAVAELRIVYAAVEAMPLQQRMALILKRVEGLTHEQIAHALHVSVPTARRRLAEAEACVARLAKEGAE